MDTVAAGSRPHQKHGIARTSRSCRSNAVGPNNAYGHGIDEGVVGVAAIEVHFATHRGHSKAVPIVTNPMHHPFDEEGCTSLIKFSEAQ